jgi:hypothetical protein
MSDLATLSVDPSLIRGIVEQEIRAAITAQLGKAPDLIQNVVALAMKQKVTDKGTVGESYYNKYDLIEVLCNNAIRETATVTVRDWVKEKTPELEKAIRAQLNKHKSEIVKAFVAAATEGLKSSFRVDCNLSLKESV